MVRSGRLSPGGCTRVCCWSAHRLATPWLARVQPADRLDRAFWAVLRIIVTFHLICLGWLVFAPTRSHRRPPCWRRSSSDRRGPPRPIWYPHPSAIIPLAVVQLFQYLADDLDVIGRAPWYVRSIFYAACFYAIVLGGQFGGKQFIYFQF